MRPPKRIAVLTGGGDCPGLNAVIRAVTKKALFYGMEVIGIEDGYEGLIEDRMRPLAYEDVSNILTRGGTVLGTSNRANPLRYVTGRNVDGTPIVENVVGLCMSRIEAHGIDALVAVGGDGTLTATQGLVSEGLLCVGVPKTIDNDVPGTDVTFGFATAVATATDALDRVHTTAASHHRALVVEVMGRNAGWIALHAGVASGSDVILIPEIPFTMDRVCEVVERRNREGKRFTVICVAEGAAPEGGDQVVKRVGSTYAETKRLGGIAGVVAAEVEMRTGIESRSVVLGHVQRGGSPVAADRILSTLFGHGAMEVLRAGRYGRMVAVQCGRLAEVEIASIAGRQRTVDAGDELLAAARSVYTSFGD